MKVKLQIQLTVVPVPPDIEIPEEKPGGGSEQQWSVMAKALPQIARTAFPSFGQDDSLLKISRSVEIEIAPDLKSLAEIAGKFDQLTWEIEADSGQKAGTHGV